MRRVSVGALVQVLSAVLLAGAPAVVRAQPVCPDGDNDGFVVCAGGCEVPAGKACGDCNDTNASINPNAAELCNFVDDDCDGVKDDGFVVARESAASVGHDCIDGVDNDGDGFVDLADPGCSDALCGSGDPPGCVAGDPGGCCVSGGVQQCTLDGTGTICFLTGPRELQEPEGPTGAANCFDLADNDCDDLPDHADPTCRGPEICNGFDDDFANGVDDGFGLGGSCQRGTGFCRRIGSVVCAADGTAGCSVVAGTPQTEGPPGSLRCRDGEDNDCDGFADLADSSCQTLNERCDGLDNNGNGEVDEGFGVGSACSSGLGVCEVQGVVMCKPDGSTSICSAVASLASTEGPSGLTCSDGVDNDCDGAVDLADDNCGGAGLRVTCALPYISGERGSDCTGWHKIVFDTDGASPNAVVTAELLALDVDGRIIESTPVQFGDEAHLLSRFKGPIKVKPGQKGTRHQVSAPVPLLRVTVEDAGRRVQAFCSNVPWLEVLEPNGIVVSASEGDVTKVVTSLPRVERSTLMVKVDGVDVLDALGKEPADCRPDSPCDGDVVVRGRTVSISELAIDMAPINTLAANTLTMKLEGLGCGGHVFVVDGDKARDLPRHVSAACYLDDVRDRGLSAGFAVEIDTPGEGQITDAVPTPVTGQVCHGRPVTAVEVNGRALSTAGQTLTPGDGEDTADTYVLPIDVAIPQTALADDIAGQVNALGTFDRGSNRLIAGATDDLANRTFTRRMFAVAGPDELVAPGLSAAARATAMAPDIAAMTADAVNDILLDNELVTAEIRDALVLGITPQALNTFFQSTCATATALAEQKINESLQNQVFSAPLDAGCGMTVNTRVTSVRFNGPLTCSITPVPNQDKVVVGVALPPTIVHTVSGGHCKKKGPFGICLISVTVDVEVDTTLSGMRVDFDITEQQIKMGGDSQGRFTPGTVSVNITRNNTRVGCIAGFFLDLLNFFLELFGLQPLDVSIEGALVEIDLTAQVGVKDFPLTMQEIKMDEQTIASSNQTLQAAIDTVDIQNEGITLSLKATFSATSDDPSILDAPGALLTPAPAPRPPQPGAGNTYFVVADDAFNQLFAAMTTQGELRTTCAPSGQSIAELAPPDCDVLGNFAIAGACKALKGVVCETLPPGEREVCAFMAGVMQFYNIEPSMELLLCGRVDVPPRMLIQDNASTDPVETTLRLNDLFLAAMLDRNGDGILGGDLSALANCFEAAADLSADCKLVAGCLDLNANVNLLLEPATLTLLPSVQGVSAPPRPPGAVCEGGINFGDIVFLQNAAASDPIGDIQTSIDTLTPGLQSNGLDLGGIVLFSNPRLIALETDGRLEFQDYIGVTGDIVPKP